MLDKLVAVINVDKESEINEEKVQIITSAVGMLELPMFDY